MPTPAPSRLSDFTSGGLQRISFARPGKLFTAHVSLFAAVAGSLAEGRLAEVRDTLIAIIQA
jgi:mRNA interferase MazF